MGTLGARAYNGVPWRGPQEANGPVGPPRSIAADCGAEPRCGRQEALPGVGERFPVKVAQLDGRVAAVVLIGVREIG